MSVFTGAFTITCAEIGNCSAKTPTLAAAVTNIAHGLIVLVGLLSVIFIIISGIQMSLSAGNAKRFQQAREALLYSCVGVVLAISAYAIVTFVAGGL